ncbi:hypothetical protein CC79DRAFT_1070438 [Sarocladium strictum]
MTQFKRNAKSQPKHGPPPNSGASRAPAAPPVRLPGWTGPSYIRKVPKRQPAAVKKTTEEIQSLPIQQQQLILDTIRTTFPAVNEFHTLKPVLKDVREALEEKDYDKAFGSEEFLEAYTIRWSPSRALGVANVLAWVCSEMSETAWLQRFLQNGGQNSSKITCLGRGGSDFLACAALLKHIHQSTFGTPESDGNAVVDLNLIDSHDWSVIVSKLQHTLTHPPPLSKYATAKAHATNVSAIPPHALSLAIKNVDILDSETDLATMIGPDPALITLFFTLHELYSTSISKTTAFLLRLTAAAPKGSLLLIVDTPGADAALPGQEKRYPVEWLLYRALLPPKTSTDPDEEEEAPAWAKLIESGHEKEYKLPAGLKYPGSLENTRLQVHLLERL